MDAQSVLKELDALKDAATVRKVFGDPVQVGDKTLIPVACVAGLFGGGFGRGGDEADEDADDAPGEGGGAGGALIARPIAMIEVTEEATVLHHIVDQTVLICGGMVLGGLGLLALGSLLRRRGG